MNEKYYCAVKALIFSGEKFLIVKRSPTARGDLYSWELPGGRLELKESPEIALVREVKEETSLDVKCAFPISTWTFMKTKNDQVIGITFLCTLQKSGTVKTSKEHDDFAWITELETGNYQFSKGVAEEIRKWDWKLIKKLKREFCKNGRLLKI
jgi:8-oxo-dGTP diphosphatase